MVNFSKILRFSIKLKGGGTLFDDYAKIYVRGGRGGNGNSSYGGIGGDGGDVYLQATPKVTLGKLTKDKPGQRFVAQNGRPSTKLNIIGEKGKDLNIAVPVGITVEAHGGKLLGELNTINEKLLVAKGAEGGSAKYEFNGQPAVPHMLHLHLKLIADIGFVGFPNAGKSTLLKALSRTNPKISSFPFTTVRPQIGTMVYDDMRRISLADLPGLIEGAHLNQGMGHKFLKHVERTMLLMFVVDLNGFQLSIDDKFRNAYETIMLLNRELELYNPALLDKPAILCVNKMDTDINQYKFKKLLEKLANRREDVEKNWPESLRPGKLIDFSHILPICAKDQQSAADLKAKLRQYLDLIDQLRRKHQQKSTTSLISMEEDQEEEKVEKMQHLYV